jgi:uncharacterized protein YaiI (UPF0178 family)
MRLLIDADACPVKREAIAEGRRCGAEVVLVGNTTQNLARFTSRDGVEAIQVGTGRDAADFVIIEELSPGDIVVTQDIGLAAMVLGRSAHAISPRGRVFSPVTIDAEMAVRHAEQQHRRAGGRTKGPPVFDDEDRERFTSSLARLFEASRGQG